MSNPKTPLLSNRLYDTLKWVAQVLLPASGALYFGLAQIWGFPNAEEVVGTIAVVNTFLGLLLGVSTKQYNDSSEKFDGELVVDTDDPAKDVYSFELDEPIEHLRDKQVLVIKVQNPRL